MNCIFGTEAFEKRQEPYDVISRDIIRDVDVCVIGSGAAGAILATKLSEAGKSVILLERGGYYDGESMNQREEDMMPLLWKNAGANFTANLKIAIAQGSCLGGSTVINDAVCFDIPYTIIKQWQKMKVAISESEWKKSNKEVVKRIHITKVKPNELNENAKKLKKACENFRLYDKKIDHRYNYRNCGPSFTDSSLTDCMQCGFCHLGCHYDTKQSMLVTYIHDALQNTKANFTAYCNCKADKITQENGNVTGVDGTFIDEQGNEKFRIRVNSKIVIVSAGSIASSNLLQKSNIGGKNVGKGLALHPAPFVMGRFKEKIFGNRGIPMSYTCHEFGVTNGVENGGFLIESIFLPVFQMAIAIPSFEKNHRRLMMDFNHYTMAGVMVRDEPNGKITLTYDDHPKVSYDLSSQTIDDMARGMGILARFWFSVGATSLVTSHRDIPEIGTKADIPKLRDAVRNNPDGLMLGSAHPQGGNKMGDDPKNCIVDSDCKVFGFKNLYVCDASVFPTPIGVNPQQTIMALATITANKIIKKWKTFKPVKRSLGKICTLSQPRYGLSKNLGEQFAIVDHKQRLFSELANSKEERIIPNKNWRFNPKTLEITNNVFWKGFYGRDINLMTTGLRFFGGFYKRFEKNNSKSFRGITHPFETKIVNAKSLATEENVPGYGTVIRLRYLDHPYTIAYDLLKMIDKDTLIGKAFLGEFPRGRELFNFSMSRVYDVDFMTEDDLLTIFNNSKFSHSPKGNEIVGKWEGMLVSDSAVSPRSQIFHFESEDGEIDMRYSFANMIRGRSDLSISNQLFKMDDQTIFHDEIRMVTPNFAVGRWVSDWSNQNALKSFIDDFKRILPVPVAREHSKSLDGITRKFRFRWPKLAKETGFSFLGVEKNADNQTRIGLSFILKRTG
ncbi:MAG: GMC family oxidoreductase [Nitrosopumilus sp.]|nr:GMC family oxidoreductase [Nitrosopumilus sp.]